MITRLKGRPNFSGELLFDDYTITFRNDPLLIAFGIACVSIMTIGYTVNIYMHHLDKDVFFLILYAVMLLFGIFYIAFFRKKYIAAKKMHKKIIKPKSIKLVKITPIKKNIIFTFKLHNNSQQKFKCRNNIKSDKLLAFLKNHKVKLVTK